MINNYRITTNRQDMDIAAIHHYLTASYWAKGVPIEIIEQAVANSLCFGVFINQQQIGFARLITDTVTFAYLADVYIEESHRGKGLSKRLMKEIIDHPQLQGLRRIVLATSDAHGLYQQFGFKQLANPQTFMELWTPDVYG